MNATLLNFLLATTGLGTLAWIAWQKKNGRPWLVKWLMAIGLLLLPIVLTKFLAPAAWLDIQTMPALIKYIAAVPFLLAVAALCGGLLVAMASAIGLFVNSLDQVERKNRSNNLPTRAQLNDPFDWYNDWYYDYYRDYSFSHSVSDDDD